MRNARSARSSGNQNCFDEFALIFDGRGTDILGDTYLGFVGSGFQRQLFDLMPQRRLGESDRLFLHLEVPDHLTGHDAV